MPTGKEDPKGQVPPDQDEEESLSDTGVEGDEESSGDEEGHRATGSDLEQMTPEQTKAEVLRLRNENARRRQREKEFKEERRKAEEEAKKSRTDAERLAALETETKEKDRKIANLLVGSELRDYLADKHPQYLKLSKRIVPFVDLDGADLDDQDEIRDRIKAAVEEFVKDVPISASPVDSNGQPVGGVGRSPARGGSPDPGDQQRRAELFPGIYKTPRQG